MNALRSGEPAACGPELADCKTAPSVCNRQPAARRKHMPTDVAVDMREALAACFAMVMHTAAGPADHREQLHLAPARQGHQRRPELI